MQVTNQVTYSGVFMGTVEGLYTVVVVVVIAFFKISFY